MRLAYVHLYRYIYIYVIIYKLHGFPSTRYNLPSRRNLIMTPATSPRPPRHNPDCGRGRILYEIEYIRSRDIIIYILYSMSKTISIITPEFSGYYYYYYYNNCYQRRRIESWRDNAPTAKLAPLCGTLDHRTFGSPVFKPLLFFFFIP